MAGQRIYINPDTAGANAHHYNRLNPSITVKVVYFALLRPARST